MGFHGREISKRHQANGELQAFGIKLTAESKLRTFAEDSSTVYTSMCFSEIRGMRQGGSTVPMGTTASLGITEKRKIGNGMPTWVKRGGRHVWPEESALFTSFKYAKGQRGRGAGVSDPATYQMNLVLRGWGERGKN